MFSVQRDAAAKMRYLRVLIFLPHLLFEVKIDRECLHLNLLFEISIYRECL